MPVPVACWPSLYGCVLRPVRVTVACDAVVGHASTLYSSVCSAVTNWTKWSDGWIHCSQCILLSNESLLLSEFQPIASSVHPQR